VKPGEAKIILNVKNINDKTEITIIDNAEGITEGDIEHIFEPYFSTKGKNGTGLYMSQMIIQKQFNSKIEVTSSKEGSVFQIVIPKKLS